MTPRELSHSYAVFIIILTAHQLLCLHTHTHTHTQDTHTHTHTHTHTDTRAHTLYTHMACPAHDTDTRTSTSPSLHGLLCTRVSIGYRLDTKETSVADVQTRTKRLTYYTQSLHARNVSHYCITVTHTHTHTHTSARTRWYSSLHRHNFFHCYLIWMALCFSCHAVLNIMLVFLQ